MNLLRWLSLLPAASLCVAELSNTTIHFIHAFPGTALENLAIRANGLILATDSLAPNLYSICPFTGNGTLVHTFPNATGLLGITETAPDVFHAVVGNYSLVDSNATTHWSIWKIDYASAKHGRAVFEKEVDVLGAGLLNGMTTLDAKRGLLLVADFFKSRVLRIDLRQKTSAVAVADILLGSVNGIKIRDSMLYFSNYNSRFMGRVAIDANGAPKGNATKMPGSQGYMIDDFTFDNQGNVYGANSDNSVTKIEAPDYGTWNSVVAIPGNPTAARFGRAKKDKGCLYVTTDAGSLYGVDVAGSGSCPQPHQ